MADKPPIKQYMSVPYSVPYWHFLLPGIPPLVLAIFACGVLLFGTDWSGRGMAEIHVINPNEQAIEVLSLTVNDAPLAMDPILNAAELQRSSVPGAGWPAWIDRSLSIRTPLLEPGVYPLRLVVRTDSSSMPMERTEYFTIARAKFCGLSVVISSEKNISGCAIQTDIIDGYPNF
jgi:hypothetical protein